MHPRTSGHVLLLFVTTLSCNERAMPTDTFGLDCIFDTRTSVTNCADVSTRRKLDLPRLRDAKQLELRRVTALRSASTLTLDIELQGRFDNDIDQNVYVFVGARSTIPSAYALTSDPQYFADLSYPVRGSLALPHTTDVRVGIMALSRERTRRKCTCVILSTRTSLERMRASSSKFKDTSFTSKYRSSDILSTKDHLFLMHSP